METTGIILRVLLQSKQTARGNEYAASDTVLARNPGGRARCEYRTNAVRGNAVAATSVANGTERGNECLMC